MREASAALDTAREGLDTAQTALVGEEAAVGRRLEGLRDEVAAVSRREREAQEAYRAQRDELDALVSQQPP